MRSFESSLVCWKCNKKFEWNQELNGYLFENDDAHIWYCEECYNKTKLKKQNSIVNFQNPKVCQWCKESIHELKLKDDLIVMHIDCYEKLINKVAATFGDDDDKSII